MTLPKRMGFCFGLYVFVSPPIQAAWWGVSFLSKKLLIMMDSISVFCQSQKWTVNEVYFESGRRIRIGQRSAIHEALQARRMCDVLPDAVQSLQTNLSISEGFWSLTLSALNFSHSAFNSSTDLSLLPTSKPATSPCLP